MYRDGCNVVIYNVDGFLSLSNVYVIVIGGLDEKWEYGFVG